MKICYLSSGIITLAILTIFDQSLLSAEIYWWTDTDGSVHFSDTPVDAPKGKQPIVRQNESTTDPSLSRRSQAPPVPLNYSQTPKSPSWMQLLQPACKQEYKEATVYCEATKPANRSEKEQCVHKRVSPKCKEQFDNAYRGMQEDTNKANKCMETRQKIYRICGYPKRENQKCHMEYMAELEAACTR